MNVVELLLDPLQYGFMVRALAVAVVAAVVCAVLSCWLVLIGWSLMGDAVSHAVLPGVVLAYVVGAPFALGALLFGLLAVLLIGAVRDTSRVKEDAAIGVVFTTLFAFDPVHAHAIWLSPRRLGALLLGLLALTVVVALQAVGVVLVVALLITPGATAYLLTDRFSRMLWISPLVAATCGVVGILASYWLDTSSGGTVVVTLGAAFALAYLFSPRHGLLTTRLAHARRRRARAAVRA